MLVLGIESTCDEASAAVVQDGTRILSNVIASQTDLHKNFGGVFPEMASRRHVEILLPVIDQAMQQAGCNFQDLALIAVAQKPGLMGSLLVGLNTAKSLSFAWNIPYVGVNHVQAHLYAAMMPSPPVFPAIGLVVSGGHTLLCTMQDILDCKIIGSTLDDAIGEAFDKTASVLNLPYPGGPEIEKLALNGNINAFTINPPKPLKNPFDFTFSGLKTKILYFAKGNNANRNSPLTIDEPEKKHLAAAFQHAAFKQVIDKTLLACQKTGYKNLYTGGGVTNSKTLKNMFAESMPPEISFYYPSSGLSLDNGAMIAGLGYHVYQKKHGSDPYDLEALPTGNQFVFS